LMYDQTPAGIRESETGISGSRSCTKSQTGVFAFLRHMSSTPKLKASAGSIRNGLNLPIGRYPEAIGDRAAAHMSLHLQPTMSKSRHASSPGSIGSGHRLYRLRRGAKRTRNPVRGRVRLLDGAYMCEPQTRQPAFCNFVAVGRWRNSDRRASGAVQSR
jgi:hypothetical protein